MKLGIWKLLALVSIATLALATLGACGPVSSESGQEHEHEAEHANETEQEGEHEHHSDMAELEAVSLAAGEKLKVVATTNIVGDIVRNVGGDRIDLTVLMGIGVDPHTYVPTPADTVAIHDAHVVLANGAGLETDLDEILENAGGDAVHIHVSDGLDFRPSPEEHDDEKAQAEHGEAEGDEGHDHGDIDPHVWFSVPNVIHWVENIEHALSALDSSNAGAYQENAHEYIHELEELDAWIQEQIAQIPEANRTLVTNHPTFGYFADRYGLEQVGAVYPINPSSEPSAQDIAALEDAILEYGVPAVFAESTVNPSLAEQVARDTRVKLVPLFTGSLSGPGGGAETYILLMRYDVDAIVEALK